MTRGFFAIGIVHGKTPVNLGTLWRSASLFGASFIFTVGNRYQKQSSDTRCTPRHTPLFHFADLDDLVRHLPHSCPLVGVELDERAADIRDHAHLERACYLLGAEDHGLAPAEIARCHRLIRLPGDASMNVSVAGSIVMFDRWQKTAPREST